MENMTLLHSDAAGLVECIWGEGVVGKGLCNAADMVAERGPEPTSDSLPWMEAALEGTAGTTPGGEQVTLQKIWEKLCCLEEVVRGKASHDEARAGGDKQT